MDAAGWGATETESALSAARLPVTFPPAFPPLSFLPSLVNKSKERTEKMHKRAGTLNVRELQTKKQWSKKCEKAIMIGPRYKSSKHSVNWAATLGDHLFQVSHSTIGTSKERQESSVAISFTSISVPTEWCTEISGSLFWSVFTVGLQQSFQARLCFLRYIHISQVYTSHSSVFASLDKPAQSDAN